MQAQAVIQTKTGRPSIRKPVSAAMPASVARWLLDHFAMPPADLRRMKALLKKVHEDSITPEENRELDLLSDCCLLHDLMRVDALAALKKQPRTARK